MRASIVGTMCVDVALDPEEFHGLSMPECERWLSCHLRSEHPGVDFWPDDIAHAAIELHRAAHPDAEWREFPDE